VVPILLKAGTAHEEFLQAYIGKNDTAYRAGWRSLVFSGQATMPKSLDGDAAVVEFVAHNAGAIGYIGKASPHEGVKVLTVNVSMAVTDKFRVGGQGYTRKIGSLDDFRPSLDWAYGDYKFASWFGGEGLDARRFWSGPDGPPHWIFGENALHI
jgi:hypothetical protein